eukprot:8407815-Pyramimonas_sp.AAC.1
MQRFDEELQGSQTSQKDPDRLMQGSVQIQLSIRLRSLPPEQLGQRFLTSSQESWPSLLSTFAPPASTRDR